MRFFKDEGIILKVENISETSKLVTLFTRNYGKVIVRARGANRKKNIFFGQLDLFFYGEFVWQKNIRNDLNTLIENDVWETFLSIRYDPVVFGCANYLLEVLLSVIQFDDKNELLFLDMLVVFRRMNIVDGNMAQMYMLFGGIKLLLSIGFLPDFERCGECGAVMTDDLFLDKRQCMILCKSCLSSRLEDRLSINKDIQRIIVTVMRKGFDSFSSLKLSINQLKMLREILNIFLDFSLEKQLKSLVFLNKIVKGNELSL